MKQNILIIDDEEATLGLIEGYFLDNGLNDVFTAKDGKSALEIFNHNSIQLVLIDAVLPDISGFEIAYKMKSNSPLTQIIMLSGLTSLEDKDKAYEHSVDEFISKPVALDELNIRVKAHFRIYDVLFSLQKTKNNFQNIVESLNEPIFVYDRDGKLIYSNRCFRNLYGSLKSLNELTAFFPQEIINNFIYGSNQFLENQKNEEFWLDFKLEDSYHKVRFLNFLDNEDWALGVIENISDSVMGDKILNSHCCQRPELVQQAAYVQKHIVTQPLPIYKTLSIQSSVVPSASIGGDLILTFEKDDKTYFIISDILGQGMNASYLSVIIKMAVKNHLQKMYQGKLNEFLSAVQKELNLLSIDYLVTILVAMVDSNNQQLSYISAGHNPPRVLYKNGVLESYSQTKWGEPLGRMTELNIDKLKIYNLDLKQIKKIAFFTDGMVEFHHSRGKDIDYSYVDTALAESFTKALEHYKNHPHDDHELDDATILVLNNKETLRENIYIKKGVNIDIITDNLLKIMRDFDFDKRELKKAFIVLQELISNMINHGKGGLVRCSFRHDRVIFIFSNQGEEFSVGKALNRIQKQLENNENFPIDLLNNVALDSSQLGLYMTYENADRFNATEDGKYIGILIKKTKQQVLYDFQI